MGLLRGFWAWRTSVNSAKTAHATRQIARNTDPDRADGTDLPPIITFRSKADRAQRKETMRQAEENRRLAEQWRRDGTLK